MAFKNGFPKYVLSSFDKCFLMLAIHLKDWFFILYSLHSEIFLFDYNLFFQRAIEPPEVKHERLFVVSVLGFLVNLVGIFAFQHGHGHTHGGGKFPLQKLVYFFSWI